jgi:hypothetical protein
MLCPSGLGTETEERRNGGAQSFSPSVTPTRIGSWQHVNACRVSPRYFVLNEELTVTLGFTDGFYKVRSSFAASSPTLIHELVVCLRAPQSMKDRYSESSENCSTLPLWGEVEAGGASSHCLLKHLEKC